MKKLQKQIKMFLFASLVVILSVLIVLYVAFCRDGNYNSVKIEQRTETTTEVPETTTEDVLSSQEDVTEVESTTTPEESTTQPSIVWKNNKPHENLLSENWALTLINKDYPLEKTYSPTLAPVIEGSSITADTRVAEEFKKMYVDAQTAGYVLTPYSGYCSYQRQQTNYNNKVQAFILQGMTEDEAKANAEKRIEPAGCSENGAGLSVDIISASAGFASTKEYEWLVENAHNYGFVLRYPSDKTEITGMIYQPWHWRYVGIDAATEMKAGNLCLEEYLEVAKTEN